MPYEVSKAALKPLMSTFWTAKGWREPRMWPDPATMARAVADGVMFEKPRVDSHDGWVDAAIRAAAAVTEAEVHEAFLESLGSRRLDLRSAFGSYVTASALRPHPITVPPGQVWCSVCSQYQGPGEEELNVLNFERLKWGGVRHSDVTYAAFDLEQFRHAPRDGASAGDRELGRAVVAALTPLWPWGPIGKSVDAVRMVPGSRAEREAMVRMLQGSETLPQF